MLQQLFNIPHSQHFILACSGGVDSIAIASFYKKGDKNFSLAYFHHATKQADEMLSFLYQWSKKNNIPLLIGRLNHLKPKDQSPEEFWRNERYKWLQSYDLPIITAHHLNDVVETYLFSVLNGCGKVIAPKHKNIWRPFLLNEKQTLIDWCKSHNETWIEDASNLDQHFPRNFIRHTLINNALKVNPGLFKVVKKKVLKLYYENEKIDNPTNSNYINNEHSQKEKVK